MPPLETVDSSSESAWCVTSLYSPSSSSPSLPLSVTVNSNSVSESSLGASTVFSISSEVTFSVLVKSAPSSS